MFAVSIPPRLGVSASPLAIRLWHEGRLPADYLEMGAWNADVLPLPGVPLILHGLGDIRSLSGPHTASVEGLRRTRDLVARTATPWTSEHLGFSVAEVDMRDGRVRCLSPLLTREETHRRIVRHVRTIAQTLDVPLLLENLDYVPGGAYEYVTEPAFIRHVIEDADCGLLLDLAHARVSAAALGLTDREYLLQLPLDRTVEIHLSGPRWVDGRLSDAHKPLAAPDYDLLRWTLTHCQPQAVTLEYRRDAKALLAQLARLRAIVSRTPGVTRAALNT